MLKNKITINKYFLGLLLVICLMFISCGFGIENSYAVELNETNDDKMEINLNVVDKLENSQSNELLGVDMDKNDQLGVERTVTGNKFSDIQDAINGANKGDVIKLTASKYYADDENSVIRIKKQLTITSTSTSVLDAGKKTLMFRIYSEADGTVINNLKFVNGEFIRGSAISIVAKNVVVENCIFENNHCLRGGAIVTDNSLYGAENLIVRNCKFYRNSATSPDGKNSSSAAAIAAFGYNSQILNCVFDSNWVLSSNDAFGGAIQVGTDTTGNKGLVSNCIFNNNSAVNPKGSSHGGAGCVRNGVQYQHCVFTNNYAGEGGALTFHASGEIINCTFKNNEAYRFGGAVSTGFLYDTMNLKITDCKFEGNKAPKGGAVQVMGLDVTISNSNFESNNAETYGGAINIEASNVNVYNSKFDSNWVNVDGGAIYIKGINTLISDNVFKSNNAIPRYDRLDDGLGGAIYIKSTQARILKNNFTYNTARNGSAIYYDKTGEKLNLAGNILFKNQAWVYGLPIHAEDIYYGDSEKIKVVIYGGNNIANYNNLAVSNAIYNAAGIDNIEIDGEKPVSGATNDGRLYQDDREYNTNILLTVTHQDGTVVYNAASNSSYLGEVIINLNNLKPGRYNVFAQHFEDTYYKGIINVTYFTVHPKVDMRVSKTANVYVCEYEDIIIWTLNISNNGPNNATEVVLYDILPEGLAWINDTSNGKYDYKTGKLDFGDFKSGENFIFTIKTVVEKTGLIVNKVNITSYEFDSDLSNNYDEKTLNVNPTYDLSVQKSVSNQTPNYGDNVTWTIVVINNGPDIAYDVVAYDVLPETLIFNGIIENYDKKSGKWNIGTLEKGSKVTLTITCTVNGTGMIENNVVVNASGRDHDLSNNHADERIFVNEASDLAIVKSVNASIVNFGDIVEWTLTISNKGPSNANNVYVADILPEGFIYLNSTLTKGYYDEGIFKISNVDVEEIVIITILSKINDTGNFTNFANVTSDTYDYDLANNEDNESIIVNPACDLSVQKSVSNSNPKYDEIIEWTIEVTNNGPDEAHNIVVYDLLPKTLIWDRDDSLGYYNPITGIWDISYLAVGETAILTIQCVVKGTGSIVNNVSVNASEFDHDLNNNYDNETIEVEKSADVSIVKLVNITNPNYNDLVKWTLIIKNNGPDKATDVHIEDILPNGLIFISYNATKGFYDNGMWAMCCLENGEVERLDIICKVNKTGEITNFASIHADEYDVDETNNYANESIDIPKTIDLEVIIAVNNPNPVFGEVVNWMIIVKNNGPDNATNIVLDEMLDENLIFDGFKLTRGIYSQGFWEIPSLNVGGIEFLNITSSSNALGEIIKNVHVGADEYDWNESNNYDDSLINIRPMADVSITKMALGSVFNLGDLVTWKLIAYNEGPNTATNVVVYDVLPKGLTFLKSNGNYIGGIWNVGNLEIGESKELEIICKITSTGKFINVASIGCDEYDPNVNNNEDKSSIFVNPASDLSITKTTSKKYYQVGDVIRYVIEVTNNGPDTTYNVKITEILDDLLHLKSFKTTKGKFNKYTKVWTIDSLKNGESARLIIQAIATGSGIIKNKVSLTSDNFDIDLSNNKDIAKVKVSKKPLKVSKINEKSKKSSLDKNPNDTLGNHASGNPLCMLVLTLIFSVIFLPCNISKKR